jgi:2'-5' RNA ligase
MRLFTGISVHENAIANLAELRSLAQLGWSPAANLHVTIKFIGEWPENQLPQLQTALAGIPPFAPIAIAVTGLSFLPQVLIADVQPAAGLAALARATEDALEPLGCTRETRPYRPHITLARIRKLDIATLRERIGGMDTHFGSFEVRNFHLYLSQPARGGSIYTKLATYP